MVRASRALLSGVTRLLIVADMIDVNRLLKSVHMVQKELELMRTASNQLQVDEAFRRFKSNADVLIQQAANRQNELKDARLRDDLAAARAVLKKNSMLLLTASKVFVRHPELKEAQENRDFIYKQICEAVETINDVAHGKANPRSPLNGPGDLAAALDYFDVLLVMDPMTYNDQYSRPVLEEQLESIITNAGLIADSPYLKDDAQRSALISECNNVRQALQDLLSEYLANTGKQSTPKLSQAIDLVSRKTQDLRQRLQEALIENIASLQFVAKSSPLFAMIEVAKAGDDVGLEKCSYEFEEHARTLIDITSNICSMCSNEDGVKTVRYACLDIEDLYPQVIRAAKSLVARTTSKPALENMEAFKNAWENQVHVLLDAVDVITPEYVIAEPVDVEKISTSREAYRYRSEEEKQKIAAQVEVFNTEKKSFEHEVSKWDDKGNEIIVIAKQMCAIMMNMTDFTRGKGPLKTTMDVINAAQQISEHGSRLDKLAGQIAEQCAESKTKDDLHAYLKRVVLFCHQLNITSRVKADVHSVSGSLVVSGLDSATSLIQAAKNLMSAVLLTVKSSYIASTKYPSRTGNVQTIVVWKEK